MKIPIYQVDAFTSELFKGNPTAIYPLMSLFQIKLCKKLRYRYICIQRKYKDKN